MRFEKWQALGNDYLIVEADGLEPERVRALCDRHRGVGADGVLALAPPDEPGYVARLRIFNPDGSEAGLSGNGAREAFMYLRRRGWTDENAFSIVTLAGTIRAEITSERTCRVEGIVAAGARDEVQRAAALGASATARQALGFEELLADDVEAMKTRTRRYAKRQLTWMRKLPGVRTIDVTGREAEDVAEELHGMIRAT